jgi:hypothetical protein
MGKFKFEDKKDLDKKSQLILDYNETNIKDNDISIVSNALSINYNSTKQLKMSYPTSNNNYNATKTRFGL